MDRGSKVECTKYRKKDIIVEEKISGEKRKNILYPECSDLV